MKIKSIFELANKKLFCISIAILVIADLSLFSSFLKDVHGLNFNIYDYLNYIFNDFTFVFWGLFITTIMVLYNLIDSAPLKRYLVMKFSSRKTFILTNILYIITYDFLLIISILIISVLQLINKTSFINRWSQYGLYKYKNTNLINYSPFNLTIKNLLAVFMYLFIIGIFMVVINLYFKKAPFVIIATLFFNLFGIVVLLAKLRKLYPISIVHNTLLIYRANLHPYIFWIFLSAVFILLSVYRVKKFDF